MTKHPTTVRVTLQQILDLALGTPEVGAVNFKILHNLLQILLNELNLTDNDVEYHDDDAKRIKNALAVQQSETYHTLEEQTVTDDTNTDRGDERNVPSDDPSMEAPAAPSPIQSADLTRQSSLMPPTASIKGPRVIPSTAFLSLSQEVGQVNDRLTEFEKNLLFLNEDVSELRNTLGIERQPPTVSMDVSEENESTDKNEQPTADGKVSEPMIVFDEDEKQVASQHRLAPSRGASSISKRRSLIAGVDLNALETDISELKTEMTQTRQEIEVIKSQINQPGGLDDDSSSKKTVAGTPRDDGATSADDNDQSVEPGAGDAGDNEDSTDRRSPTPQVIPTSSSSHVRLQKVRSGSRKSHLQESSVSVSEKKSHGHISDKYVGKEHEHATKTKLSEAVQNMEIIYSEAVRNLESRVAELEKEMRKLNETLSHTKTGDPESIHEIQALVMKMQDAYADIEKINQIAARLSDEDDKKDSHEDVIMEQIELLKTIKADREDLEDALADKADASTVNKKVSYDRFNTACDDLARGLEDTITKLAQQEYIWQQSLDTVQQEIDNKLDRVEMSPIQEFINNRLHSLQEKIKKLAAKKSENEAAGTRKVLTGLQCISCDKNAVMKIEQGANHQHIAVPPTRNIKPYLTYELDQIRKQQKKFSGKNMNYLSAAMQEMGKKTRPPMRDALVEKTSQDHLCNRYCGGSHTVITPQQRVMRMGHFLAQWGPDAVQLTQGVVRGTDGQLYHSRSMPPGASATSTRDVCGPSVNTCCGMQSQNPTNQHMPQNRSGIIPESGPMSQRRLSHKEQKHIDNLPHTTPRSGSKKPQINPEVQSRSPTAPPSEINHGEYDGMRGQKDGNHFGVSPEEI